jgi:hypothetical protein
LIPEGSQAFSGLTGANGQSNIASSTKQANGQSHYIHDAIERKIERFSRQRNRGALIVGSTNAAAQVYSQPLTPQQTAIQPL